MQERRIPDDILRLFDDAATIERGRVAISAWAREQAESLRYGDVIEMPDPITDKMKRYAKGERGKLYRLRRAGENQE